LPRKKKKLARFVSEACLVSGEKHKSLKNADTFRGATAIASFYFFLVVKRQSIDEVGRWGQCFDHYF
jgi:hypothetical protein